jgi:hypothetical protein
VFLSGLGGVQIGRRLERRRAMTVGPAPVATVRQPVLCTLSGRPIEQCPPEHRHFPTRTSGLPFRPPAPPEQAPQVARTPLRPATVPTPPKPKPQPTPRKERGRHWPVGTVHTQAMPAVDAEEGS